MSKHLSKTCMYTMPSGVQIHPCRLIFKDGTLMWKHALLSNNEFTQVPQTQAHEQHIIKTAKRLEELNSWVSQDLEPWESIVPCAWYDPNTPELSEGISVYFKHSIHKSDYVYDLLQEHVQPHEELNIVERFPISPLLYFKRCGAT